jgi:hypothetical protein
MIESDVDDAGAEQRQQAREWRTSVAHVAKHVVLK